MTEAPGAGDAVAQHWYAMAPENVASKLGATTTTAGFLYGWPNPTTLAADPPRCTGQSVRSGSRFRPSCERTAEGVKVDHRAAAALTEQFGSDLTCFGGFEPRLVGSRMTVAVVGDSVRGSADGEVDWRRFRWAGW